MRKYFLMAIVVMAVLTLGCASKLVTTETSKATPTQAVTTPTKEEPRGSYSNPASMDEVVIVRTPSGTFEVSVLDYIRGEEAYQLIKEANVLNPNPEDGYEYLLVKVRFKYVSGNNARYVTAYDFKAYSEGAGYSPTWVVMPDSLPEFKNVKLVPGGAIEGGLFSRFQRIRML